VSGHTAYNVCLYGDGPTLIGTYSIAKAGQVCGTKACWRALATKGYKYFDKDAGSDGIFKIVVRGGDSGVGSVVVKGKNNSSKGQTSLPMGIASVLSGSSEAIVQIISSDADCFGSTLPNVKRADGSTFKAVSP